MLQSLTTEHVNVSEDSVVDVTSEGSTSSTASRKCLLKDCILVYLMFIFVFSYHRINLFNTNSQTEFCRTVICVRSSIISCKHAKTRTYGSSTSAQDEEKSRKIKVLQDQIRITKIVIVTKEIIEKIKT